MARKKTQWITFHDDTNEKAIVRQILRDKFSLHALQDEVLYFSKVSGHLVSLGDGYHSETEILRKFFVHYPDLFCPYSNPKVVIEIDGDVHWQNSNAVKRTNSRNTHYEFARLRFLWLSREEVLMNSVPQLTKIISCRLGEK